jgi:hypothetical protein
MHNQSAEIASAVSANSIANPAERPEYQEGILALYSPCWKRAQITSALLRE